MFDDKENKVRKALSEIKLSNFHFIFTPSQCYGIRLEQNKTFIIVDWKSAFKCTVAVSPDLSIDIKQILALSEPFSSQPESKATVGNNINLTHKTFSLSSVETDMPQFI